MLLVYVPKLTNRVGYTINVVMRDILHTEFGITTDKEIFLNHTGARLCYAPNKVGDSTVPYIKSTNILFETTIYDLECHYFEYEGLPAIFPTFGRDIDFPFDILGAIFFMVSRYEEYLPYRTDEHGRFMATESFAYKHNFLNIAIVDRWALMIKELILKYYPDTHFGKRSLSLVQTIDIDAAYCYRNKGIIRSTLGIMRDLANDKNANAVKHRFRVILGKEPDPFDTFDYIISQSKQYPSSHLIFFALLADYDIYDKPTHYQNNEFQRLLQHLGDYSKVGIHGSYNSSEKPWLIDKEIHRLSDILHRPIYRNRYHFLRFSTPKAYPSLVRAGITQDYSMGFADLPGFRCGCCSTIPFFHLSRNEELAVNMHPFAVMDTTLHNHMGLSTADSIKVYHDLIDEVRDVEGTFSCIFHNQNLCESFGWEGWREVYEEVLRYASK